MDVKLKIKKLNPCFYPYLQVVSFYPYFQVVSVGGGIIFFTDSDPSNKSAVWRFDLNTPDQEAERILIAENSEITNAITADVGLNRLFVSLDHKTYGSIISINYNGGEQVVIDANVGTYIYGLAVDTNNQ